jgi:hypothetical protein
MRGYVSQFNALGWGVISRWIHLDEKEAWAKGDTRTVARQLSTDDLEDINASTVVFCFTEPPGGGPARGGRHVEFGYALALKKRAVIIAPEGLENIFYSQATFVAKTLDEAFAWLRGYTER